MVTAEGALTSHEWWLFLGRVVQEIGQNTSGLPSALRAPACVLLLCNAPIHDAAGDALPENDVIPMMRLPPHFPDFQLMESVVNDVKVMIRNSVDFNQHVLQDVARLQALAASCITEQSIVGQFVRVERRFARMLAGQGP